MFPMSCAPAWPHSCQNTLCKGPTPHSLACDSMHQVHLCMFLCQKRLPQTFTPFAAQSFNLLPLMYVRCPVPSCPTTSSQWSVMQSICALKCALVNWFLPSNSILTPDIDLRYLCLRPSLCGICVYTNPHSIKVIKVFFYDMIGTSLQLLHSISVPKFRG